MPRKLITITERQKATIRRKHATGISSIRQLAREYRVSFDRIDNIVSQSPYCPIKAEH